MRFCLEGSAHHSGHGVGKGTVFEWSLGFATRRSGERLARDCVIPSGKASNLSPERGHNTLGDTEAMHLECSSRMNSGQVHVECAPCTLAQEVHVECLALGTCRVCTCSGTDGAPCTLAQERCMLSAHLALCLDVT